MGYYEMREIWKCQIKKSWREKTVAEKKGPHQRGWKSSKENENGVMQLFNKKAICTYYVDQPFDFYPNIR